MFELLSSYSISLLSLAVLMSNPRWSLGPSFLTQIASPPELTNFTAFGMVLFQPNSLVRKSILSWKKTILSSSSVLGMK